MTEQIKILPLAKVHSSPLNPRKVFDKEKMDELADSIKNEGLQQPITVRPYAKKAGDFEVIFGERRYRAHKMIGAKTIKAIVKDISDDEARITMLLENLHRQDLSQLDEGEHFKELHEVHKIALREIARRISKDVAYVSHRYNLVKKLSPAVKSLMEPKKGVAQGNILDYAIARELTNLSQRDQEILAKKTVTEGLTRNEMVKRKKRAEEIVLQIERLPKGKFRTEMETKYLPKKFDAPTLSQLEIEVKKKQGEWIEKPKFEMEIVPYIKRGNSLQTDYADRIMTVEGKLKALDLDKAKTAIENFLKENPDLDFWIFVVKY